MNEINLKSIKPKVKGESDKYSWQLYEFVRRNYGRFNGLPNVYYIQTQQHWNEQKQDTEYIEVPFNYNDFNRGQVLIGHNNRDGWYSGNYLSGIIGCSRDKYTVFAIHWLVNRNVIEITDWFWNEYLKIGRCIWDKCHHGFLTNTDKRFVYINKNSRKCQWCGQWQTRQIEKKVKIERNIVWI